MRVLVAAGLALGAAAAAAQQRPGQPPAGTPRFRAAANVVVVEATVVDRRGAVVDALGAADFKVEIDGKPREVVSAELVAYGGTSPAGTARPADPDITTNEPIERARLVLLVVDQRSLRQESRPVIDAARRWVLSLAPQDRVGLVTFPNAGPRVDFTSEHARIADMLDHVAGLGTPPPPFQQHTVSIWEAIRMTDGDLFTIDEVMTRECPPRNRPPGCTDEVNLQARTIVMDAKAQTEPVLRSLQTIFRGLAVFPGPKHAVLLSSGWVMNERDAATEMSWIAGEAARANVTVHTFTAEQWALSASRVKVSPKPYQDQNLLLSTVEMLSGMTGGRAVRLTGSYDGAFTALNAALAGYYRLGVQALPQDIDGKNHKITVKVSKPGTTVQAYRRVLATPSRPVPALAPDAALREALKSGEAVTGLDLRATSYLLHGVRAGRSLRVVAVGDVGRAAEGTATAVAALYELDGKPITAMQNSVQVPASGRAPLSVELTAPPGTYALRLAVLDAEGRIGSLERLVDVRWQKAGAVETPGLVLFRAGLTAAEAPRPVFDKVTTADRLIAQVALAGPVAASRTEVAFDVLGPGSAAPVVHRVGQIAKTTAGATVAWDSIDLSELAPGRYTLSATIRPGDAKPFTRVFVLEAR